MPTIKLTRPSTESSISILVNDCIDTVAKRKNDMSMALRIELNINLASSDLMTPCKHLHPILFMINYLHVHKRMISKIKTTMVNVTNRIAMIRFVPLKLVSR